MLSFCLLFALIVEQALASSCSSSYKAPFDLSGSPTFSVASEQFPGTYYIQPCGYVDSSLCPYSAGQQQCFAISTWELLSDGLGDPHATKWSAVDPLDWTKGIIAVNTDIAYDYDQCVSDPATNSFKVTYHCDRGTNQITIVSEPSADQNGACVFELLVDSSVVCSYGGSSSSTAPSFQSTGIIQPAAPQCWMVAPSYRLPFDLSTTPTLSIASPTFSGATYHIQPCGWVPQSHCSFVGVNAQQCVEYRNRSYTMGQPTETQWVWVDEKDPKQGIMSSNIDMGDAFQCDSQTRLSMFKVTYICSKGADAIVVVGEPSINKTSPCRFEFLVDSSAFCKWLRTADLSIENSNYYISDPSNIHSIDQQTNQYSYIVTMCLVNSAFLFSGLLLVSCLYVLLQRFKIHRSPSSGDTKLTSQYPHHTSKNESIETLL